MLISKNLENRTYEEMLTEAILQIPLYSKEWTNFNPSDPAITILENLTAFETLQEVDINQVTPAIRQKLLKMVGFEGRKGRPARVLLAADLKGKPLVLPANQRFVVGDLSFETNRKLLLQDRHVTRIFGKRGEVVKDYSYLLDSNLPMPAAVFGEKPAALDELYFCLDSAPETSEELIFYVTVADQHNRNPFEEKVGNTFASMRFECYTTEGFVPIHVKDATGCFLLSGEVRMRMPEEPMIPCDAVEGKPYCIRIVLEQADYDVCPKLLSVQGFLFEAWQKESLSLSYTFQKASRVMVAGTIGREGYVQVYCREEKGSSYHKYEQWMSGSTNGRFYQRVEDVDENGQEVDSYLFDKQVTGYGPAKVKNAVRIVSYTERMMKQYALGQVYGYDHQEIFLPVQNVVTDSFCILAKRVTVDGEELYDFVRPNRYEEGNLVYYLLENEGKIVIEEPGDFIGAELYIAACAITRGQDGNVRAGNRFMAEGVGRGITFYNPGVGTGGCFRESIQDVKRRFAEDIKKPYTVVTAQDYEGLVAKTPGLCIRKVHACYWEADSTVRIAVMPNVDEPFPKLSATYRKVLEKRVEERRLLNTRVEIAEPVYLPIHVTGVLYVNQHYQEEDRKQIEDCIRENVDYIYSDRNFGEVLQFDQVFRALESLDCVGYIADLTMYPQNLGMAQVKENNIIPAYNCLCYAGNISLELRTYHKA